MTKDSCFSFAKYCLDDQRFAVFCHGRPLIFVVAHEDNTAFPLVFTTRCRSSGVFSSKFGVSFQFLTELETPIYSLFLSSNHCCMHDM
jgi:hypothetical protein